MLATSGKLIKLTITENYTTFKHVTQLKEVIFTKEPQEIPTVNTIPSWKLITPNIKLNIPENVTEGIESIFFVSQHKLLTHNKRQIVWS